MRSEVEGWAIRFTEVPCSAHFNLAHFEFVSDGCTRYTEVSLVELLNVNYNEGH